MYLRIISLFCVLWLGHTRVTLTNNGYNNLVVAIGEDVPEDSSLIEQIKTVMTNASAYMYTATRRRAYFKDITILVPETWRDRALYERVTNERFDVAEIRVDEPTFPGAHGAYVRTPALVCGMPGVYMHITPFRLTDKRINSQTPSERMIVHEWGHLRWGVFDEYPTDIDRIAYPSISGSGTEATACSVNLAKEGKVQDAGGRDCSPFDIHHSCQYHPPKDPTARGSVMFKQYISSVNTFCDDGTDESTKHNPLAPNNQNIYCHYRSTWDVIQSHEDFKDGNNPPGAADKNTKPKFRVVRSGSRRDNVVLVLDLSVSLASDNRIEALRQSARLFIAGVGDGTGVSLVTFQGLAATRVGLREIGDSRDRLDIMAMLPTRDELHGQTSIGAGITEALKVLTGVDIDERTVPGDIPPSGGTIVVITDGEENMKPFINSVVPLVSAAKATVYPIGLSSDASQRLSLLAEPTSGVTFFIDTDEKETSTQKLSEAMVTVLDMMQQSPSNRIVQLHSSSVAVSSSRHVNGSVMLDSALGMHTIFMFMWSKVVPKKHTIHVRLVSPSGKVINHTDPAFNVDRPFMAVQISLPDKAESGTWKYRIYNPASVSQFISLSVTSKQAVNDTPITVQARLSQTVVSFPNPVVVSVDVMKGYMVVMGAIVEATISRPGTTPVTLTLIDNGVAPDVAAGDGTYTAYFTSYAGNGRYNVVVKVNADADTAEIMQMTPPDDLVALSDNEMNLAGMVRHSESPKRQAVSEFSRMRSAGAFELKGFDDSSDMMAPARVTDLRPVGSSLSGSTVTLQWAAPGDDAYTGRADKYSLRISGSFSDLLHRFNESVEISHSDVVGGSLIPVSGGTLQRLTVRVPMEAAEHHYFIALETYDEAANPSGVSNIIQINLEENTSDAITTSGSLLMSLLLLLVSQLL